MWSRVIQTRFGNDILETIDSNSRRLGLKYHNVDHIKRMYLFLEAISCPYVAVLDYAILFHDYVYDGAPFKEERSALEASYLLLEAGVPQEAVDQIVMLILATADHKLTADSSMNTITMVMADLHQLAVPSAIKEDYTNIILESANLYKIPVQEIQNRNKDFMYTLRATVANNVRYSSYKELPTHAEFFTKVLQGINAVISLAEGPL